ncbi:MAG: hypothetical protein NWF06_10710 [Candidatus Bathyarchaeota archaeon]|nr:hypothetical protein [Candidatus Bathyarchaeum sp.]
MGLEFKPKLSVIIAAIHGVSIALSYIVTQGDITAMVLWAAVSAGATAGLSYYTEQEQTDDSVESSAS